MTNNQIITICWGGLKSDAGGDENKEKVDDDLGCFSSAVIFEH